VPWVKSSVGGKESLPTRGKKKTPTQDPTTPTKDPTPTPNPTLSRTPHSSTEEEGLNKPTPHSGPKLPRRTGIITQAKPTHKHSCRVTVNYRYRLKRPFSFVSKDRKNRVIRWPVELVTKGTLGFVRAGLLQKEHLSLGFIRLDWGGQKLSRSTDT